MQKSIASALPASIPLATRMAEDDRNTLEMALSVIPRDLRRPIVDMFSKSIISRPDIILKPATIVIRINMSSKNNFEKEHIFTGNNTILGISVYEGWIYFLEDTQGIGGLPYSLSKVNSSGERYTVISATDASFLDISEDILFLRTYTIEGMRDSLYTLSITGDSLVETIIDNHDITIRKNDILDSVISTNENKKILSRIRHSKIYHGNLNNFFKYTFKMTGV